LISLFNRVSLHLQPFSLTPSKISLTKAELGDDVTLICSTTGIDNNLLSWFKYELGYVIKTVGKINYGIVQMYGQFNSSRFGIIPEAKGGSLSISNVSQEDEGTYLCQAGSYLTMRFFNGSHLATFIICKIVLLQDDEEAELNYAALRFPPKTKNLRRTNEFTEDNF
uniref:Ig-like domain-containing protein n=1 Tax=Oryzias latipes TaxID=8090 RepID=A0A3P9LVU0_ORYLA